MSCKLIGVATTFCMLAGIGVAQAATTAASDLSQPTLPTFALNAPPDQPSPWTGLYVGTEVLGFSGGKGVKGGFGGGAYAGYDRELDNGIVVGIQGTTGYSPGFFKHSPGFEFATTDVRVGYDMGRFMPFVTAGVGLASPNGRSPGYTGAANAATDLFNSSGDLRGFQSMGAGFAYKVTDKLTVELAVQAYRGNGFVAP